MSYYYSQAESANKFLESLTEDIKSGKINIHDLSNIKEFIETYDAMKTRKQEQ